MYVELFESGDSSFYLGTVTAITQNTGYTVFDVTVVKAEGGPSLTGGVRVKIFELADASVDLNGYLQTSGGTLTGLLTINKASGTALTVQNSGTTTLTVLNDGTITTTKTTFGNDHLITKNYVDTAVSGVTANSLGLATVATTGSYNNLKNRPTIPSAASNYVKTNSTGFNNNLTITKSGSKYYISGG